MTAKLLGRLPDSNGLPTLNDTDRSGAFVIAYVSAKSVEHDLDDDTDVVKYRIDALEVMHNDEEHRAAQELLDTAMARRTGQPRLTSIDGEGGAVPDGVDPDTGEVKSF